MKIVIANDHKGTKLKNKIVGFLEKKGYEIVDIGTSSEESVDYPEYAFKLCENISRNENSLGILICGTGIGMSIAANKVKGIRCALVHNVLEAQLTKEHNNANVLALSSKQRFTNIKKIVLKFIETPFSNEERHINRIKLIKEYEDKNNA